eukprot:CAMPEP_0184678716 /NCGR_PEP_ID=MMETSP0312-20130426/1510_1 /TAXON_ID=31354 /ORGANISM="Compsopogon coeruleus, Strain SAG 36.94" /LENGTH=43 /DNA_ID= /DNA_START= /DNA_END= /DNA_ORIENTATION=
MNVPSFIVLESMINREEEIMDAIGVRDVQGREIDHVEFLEKCA